MKSVLGMVLLVALGGSVAYLALDRRGDETSPKTTFSSEGSAAKQRNTNRQYTVLLDVSASRPKHMISQGEAFVYTLVDRMEFGDRLVALGMFEEGVNDPKQSLILPINEPPDATSLDKSERLEGSRKIAKEALERFFHEYESKPILHTDIITTLSIASEQMSPRAHNCLVVLSDMLQSSKQFEFEHLRRMPPSSWISEAQKQSLIHPLYGSSVIIIGADSTTREGVAVRKFWQEYFEASNATLDSQNYRTTPPSEPTACE